MHLSEVLFVLFELVDKVSSSWSCTPNIIRIIPIILEKTSGGIIFLAHLDKVLVFPQSRIPGQLFILLIWLCGLTCDTDPSCVENLSPLL